MIVRFDSSSTTSAQHVATLPKGAWLKIWGAFPFWIGKSRAGLESPQPMPTAANLECRDGMYIANNPVQSGEIKPTIIPWSGDLWILNNGAFPGESVSNVVIFDAEDPPC